MRVASFSSEMALWLGVARPRPRSLREIAEASLGLMALIALLALGAWQLSQSPYRLLINDTPSIPYGPYLLTLQGSEWEPQVGELITYAPLIPDWAWGRASSAKTYTKFIGAVPGEWIQVEGRQLWACPSRESSAKDCRDLGKVLAKDSKGLPIPPPSQTWGTGMKIPAGYYFVSALRIPNSFDSRYQGLIPRERIFGTTRPLMP